MRARAQVEARISHLITLGIHQMNDPRLPLIVSVERVTISPDFSQAWVEIDAIERPEQTAEVLNGARGHLQKILAQELKTRRVPKLHFQVLTP